jgi:hypothetical protein
LTGHPGTRTRASLIRPRAATCGNLVPQAEGRTPAAPCVTAGLKAAAYIIDFHGQLQDTCNSGG